MNKNDLKWCKDVWDLPSPNFKNIFDYAGKDYGKHSKCTKSHQPENFVPNGQDIFEKDIGNGLVYNCFNRADEDPFKKVAYNQSEDEGEKSWSDWVTTPCQSYDMRTPMRRCLGQKPSQCVYYTGTFNQSHCIEVVQGAPVNQDTIDCECVAYFEQKNVFKKSKKMFLKKI